jgi:CRISPR-associated protein (TIGR03986 family)
LFRYPFAKEVKDIIAQEDIIGLDFCQSLFGTVNDGAVRGRIAFSHCNITRKTDSDSYKTVLGKPQATCSAHYLEQDRSKVSAKDNQYDSKKKTNIKLTDCNSPSASSRGRKLYWHRDVDCVPPPNDNENVVSELHPVGKDSIFTSTVYLDRVSTLEIGGLLKALELPDGHAHKLGLAKSMGFGSVRITVKESKLYCDQQRYTSLSGRFGGNGEEVDYNACRQLFEKEILAGLAQKGRNENSFEELAEIKTLRIMMDYNNRPPKEHTAMMPLQYDKTNPEKPCYTRKAILRTPEEIRRINSR